MSKSGHNIGANGFKTSKAQEQNTESTFYFMNITLELIKENINQKEKPRETI